MSYIIRNKYRVENSVAYIITKTVQHGVVEFMIDVNDLEKISAHHWRPALYSGRFYATADTVKNGKKSCFQMHRLVTDFSIEMVDHANNNSRDNRRSNLRECNSSQNAMNRKDREDNTSGARGIGYNKLKRKFVARIGASGKRIYLGTFDLKSDAIEAYNRAVKIHHGEFGVLVNHDSRAVKVTGK